MPMTRDSILVLSSDIEMMREVLTRAGLDKRALFDNQEISQKAAELVMTRFRSGMIDADELLGELLFQFGKQPRSRIEPPSPLPQYAIQGLPAHLCPRNDVKH